MWLQSNAMFTIREHPGTSTVPSRAGSKSAATAIAWRMKRIVMLSPGDHVSGTGALARWISITGTGLTERSRRLVLVLCPRMEAVIMAWLLIFGAAATIRILFALTPIRGVIDFAEIFLPYSLATLAPVAGYRIAMAAFPGGMLPGQPGFRLALYGRWRKLTPADARAHPAFGPFGFMASLLIGMLLNVAIRSFEFLLAVPALNHHAPEWGTTIFHMMALDVIAMNFLYGVCFVMALRSIPLFPRMLVFAWTMDVALQLAIASNVAASAELPGSVAVAMEGLLRGNVTKVMISAAVWLPYLLLSDRVNVTYRSRVQP